MAADMQTQEVQEKVSLINRSELIKWIITFMVPLLVWMLPMPFDPKVKTFLIITSWAVTAWVTVIVPVEVTGVLIPCLFLFFEVTTPTNIFAPWANTVVWGTVALLLIGLAANASGLSTRLAYALLLRMKTNLKGLVWGFSIAGIPLSFLLTDSFVRMIVFLTIAIGICKALGIEPKSKEATALTLAAFFGMAGPSIGTLPGGVGIQVNSVFQETTGYYITYVQWFMHNMIPSLAWTAAGVFSILKVLKIKDENRFDAREELQKRYAELGKLSRREKMTLVFLLFVVIDYIGATYVDLDPLLMPIFFVPFMFMPGINVLSMEDFDKADFKILFVMTGAICIGATAGKVGLIKIIIENLTPLIAGSGVKMVIGTYIFSTLANFILTPLAIVFTFTELFTQMAISAGINPLPVVYALNFGTDVYVFPYEYVILLVAYSFGYMAYKETIKVLLVRTLLSALVMGLVAVPLWMMMGLI